MDESKMHRHVPCGMVEEILFRLPVKSLLRFRSVCKQWKTTISDDARFADARLQVSRNSARTLLLVRSYHRAADEYDASFLITTHQAHVSDDNHLRVISAVDYPPPQLPFISSRRYKTLCHCDGIHLITYLNPRARAYDYVLWNPSNRTYNRLSYPYSFKTENRRNNIFGICYDPTVRNNYKVVIGGVDGYAVFNCRANSWSKMRDATTLFSEYAYAGSAAASLQGSLYWAFWTRAERRPYNEDDDDRCQTQIVCFDGRDEELKCVRKFKGVGRLRLVSSPEAVYVLRDLRVGCGEMEVWKIRDEGEGDEVKVVRLPSVDSLIYPICWIHPDKIIVEEPVGKYLLYDHITGSFQRIQQYTSISTSLQIYLRIRSPHLENLFCL